MSKLILEEQVAPSAPSTNKVAIYPKSDGKLYIKNDLGVEQKILDGVHASDHTDGTDDIQNATNSQKGLATIAQVIAIENNTDKISYTDTIPVGLNTTHRGLTTGNPHSVSKTDIGLSNVTDDAQLKTDQLQIVITDDDAKVPSSGAVVDYVAGFSRGDMLATTYDPDGIAGDVFEMDNMIEGTSKILTTAERTAISDNTTHRGLTTGNPHGVDASEIPLESLNVDPSKSVQRWFDHTQAAGYYGGGEFTDNGDGSLTVAAGDGIIKATNVLDAVNMFFEWAENTAISLVNESTNYIFVQYDSTTPFVTSSTTKPTDARTNILLGKVFREDNALHMFKAGMYIPELGKNVLARFTSEFGEITRTSGGIISGTGLTLACTDAVVWGGLTRSTTIGYDTNISGTFEYYYYDGTDWIETDVTEISNIYYNDTTSGLVALGKDYGIHWVYIDADGHMMVVYGQDQYKLGEAQDAQPPDSLPLHITEFAWLAAKVIVEKDGTVFIEIQSAYDISFTSSTSGVHNDLGGLQGGSADEYYHLTANQFAVATQAASTTLNGYLSTTDWDTFNVKAASGSNSDITELKALDGSDLDLGGGYIVNTQNFPDILANGPGYWFDGINDKITVANDANLNIGVGDFSVISCMKTANIAAYDCFASKYDGTTGWTLSIGPAGKVYASLNDGTGVLGGDLSNGSYNDNKNHIMALLFDRSADVTLYADGKEDGTTDISTKSATLDNVHAFEIGVSKNSLNPFGGSIYRTLFFNLLLDNTDPTDKAIINGGAVPYKYQGASQTNLSENIEHVDWVDYNGLSIDNQSDPDGETNAILMTPNVGATDVAVANQNGAISIIGGKSFKFSVWLKMATGSSNIKISIRDDKDVVTVTDCSVTTTWTRFKVVAENVCSGDIDLIIGGFDSWSEADGTMSIYDPILTQIGCVADFSNGGFTTTKMLDLSGNGSDGTVSGPVLVNPIVASAEQVINIPSGKIESTTVQEALNELDSEIIDTHIAQLVDGPGYWFDGVGDVIVFTPITVDLNNFSYVAVAQQDSNANISTLIGGTSGSRSHIWITPAGTLVLENDLGGEQFITEVISTDYKPHIFAVTLDDLNPSVYVDGVPYSITSNNLSSTALTLSKIGIGATSYPWLGLQWAVRLFNFPLSGDDPTDKAIINGGAVPYKYQGASQTPLIEYTFDSDVTALPLISGDETSTWVWDTDHGVLAVTSVGTDDQRPVLTNSSLSPDPEIGKMYRVSFSFTVNSGICHITRVLFDNSSVNINYQLIGSGIFSYDVLDAYTGEDDDIGLYFDGTNLFDIDIDDVLVTQIGCTLDLNGDGVTDTKWLDQSGNASDGTVSGAIAINKQAVATDGTDGYIDGVLNLTGGQIAFPSTAVPSSDPNTLDDYEDGAFTCVATPSTSGTVTLANNTINYTKIGGSCTINGYITIDSVSSPVGDIKFSLPFTDRTSSSRTSGSVSVSGVTYIADYLTLVVLGLTNYFRIAKNKSSATITWFYGDDLLAGDSYYLGLNYLV